MVMVEKTSESISEEQHEGGGNKYDITFTPRREEVKIQGNMETESMVVAEVSIKCFCSI